MAAFLISCNMFLYLMEEKVILHTHLAWNVS